MHTLLRNYFLLPDPCNDVQCDITGEECIVVQLAGAFEGVCKCGKADSCAGNENGSYCDAVQSQCKCTEAVDACSEGQMCINGACKGMRN